MTKTTSDIFVADPEGFRAQNSDRPPAHLVRELVQNALDEDGAVNLDVTVTYHGPRKGTTVVVKDDSPQGVRDLKLLFTIWLSDKEDSPTKRGRMGRGLKELVSVADLTIIRTCSQDALVFKRKQGGAWSRSEKPKLGRPERGTEVSAFVRGWGAKAAEEIVAFLRRIRAPGRITMRVNGEQVVPFAATEVYSETLETVVYEVKDGERASRERHRTCEVQCFSPPPGERAWVYEMGIPVEQCDSPVSIDVGQRVVLRERRDTLTESYKRTLFAKVLSLRIDRLDDDQLRDNATLVAAQHSYFLSGEARARIAKVWTGGKPYAATPASRAAATGHHVECVNLRSLPEAIRDLVRGENQDVSEVLKARQGEFCPEIPAEARTPGQAKLVGFFEWVAAGIGRPCRVTVRSGRPGALADFSRSDRLLSVYAEAVGKAYFSDPAGPKPLATLIHELAHWEAKADEHGAEFHADGDDVGGMVASFLLARAGQARTFLDA